MIVSGYVCGPRLYEYEGWFFEIHSYCGPCPLRKDGAPWQVVPQRFWQMYERFQKLSAGERATYRVGGGCTPLVSGEVP